MGSHSQPALTGPTLAELACPNLITEQLARTLHIQRPVWASSTISTLTVSNGTTWRVITRSPQCVSPGTSQKILLPRSGGCACCLLTNTTARLWSRIVEVLVIKANYTNINDRKCK